MADGRERLREEEKTARRERKRERERERGRVIDIKQPLKRSQPITEFISRVREVPDGL